MTPLRVLLVEDERDDAAMLIDELRRGDLDPVVQRVDSEAALRAALAQPHDIVVCDNDLPGFSGICALRIIREHDPDMPVIVVSGTIGEELAVDMIRSGANDYVMKDNLRRLVPAVRRELAEAESRRSRTRLEDELRRVQQQLAAIFDQAPVGIAVVGADMRFVKANDRFARILGRETADLLGRPVFEFSPADEPERIGHAMERLEAGSPFETFEKRYVRPDGTLVFGRMTASLLAADGEVQYLGIVEDFTEQKTTAERLRFQARLLDCVDEAIIATDLDGTITHWNPFAEQLYGWSPDEAIGRTILDATGIDARSVARVLDRLPGESWSGEVTLRHRDGTLFSGAVTHSAITDPSGQLIGMVAVSRDISAAKCAEEALRSSEQKYRELVESAHEGIGIVGRNGIVEFVNEELARMHGYERAELVGATAAEFVHPDDRPQLMNLDPFRNRDVRLLRKDGSTLWTTLTRSLLDDDRLLFLVSDNSARKAAEDALRDREQMLVRTQQLAHIGSWEFDIRTGVRHWSSQLFGMAGVPESGGPNLPLLFEHVDEKDRDEVMDVNPRIMAGERPEVEYRLRNSAGVYRDIVTSGELVYDDAGQPLRIVGFSQDVTDRKKTEAQLRSNSIRQEAVAELSAAVLAGGPLRPMFDKAVQIVATVLEADRIELLEYLGDNEFLIAASNWPQMEPGTRFDSGPSSAITNAAQTGNSFVVDDITSDCRFSGAKILVDDGLRSGVGCPIRRAAATVGVLTAQSRKVSAFDNDDRNFIRTVSNVIAQAVERDRADAELVEVAQRQIALAALAREALAGVTRELLEGAVHTVASHIGADECWLAQIEGDPESHQPRFAARFGDGQTGVDAASMVETALAARRIVTIDDGSVAGVCIAVAGQEAPFAVLGAFSRRKQPFPERDAHFVEAVANTLAEAIERDAAQRALAASEEKHRAVVEGASEIIFTIDERGTFGSLNAAFGALTGWKRGEWIGRPFISIIAPDDHERAMDTFLSMMRGERVIESEFGIVARNGGTVMVLITAGPLFKDGRIAGVQGFARDVTETRRVEAERERLESQLAQASRLTSLGRLAATMAHEFNNVLMGISPFVEILRRRNITDERRVESLDHMKASILRGKRVTEEILRFTRPAPPVVDRVEVAPFAASLLSELRSSLPPSFDFSVDVADPSLALTADVNQLNQIVLNLVYNARDAMPEGGPIMITFSRPEENARFDFGIVSNPDRFVHISVADRGCGMPPDTLRHVFEPLFTTKRNGTGLGLAITHQVVKRHGGELFVETTVGAGSTFHIFLPAAECAPAARVDDAPRVDVRGKNVLLVEDDAVVASAIEAMLHAEGFAVTTVATGGEVMPALASALPDVVVLDIHLPDVDGITVYGEIAKLFPRLPVIFSTGHGDERSVDPYLEHGNVALLLKPYTIDTLLTTMASVAGR